MPTLRSCTSICILDQSAQPFGQGEWMRLMPLLWLRIATVLYGLGLLHAVLQLTSKNERMGRIAVPAVGLGMVFHFVSLTETAILNGYGDLLTIRYAESLLALIIVAIFLVIFSKYRTTTPGVFVFPLVFLLTF